MWPGVGREWLPTRLPTTLSSVVIRDRTPVRVRGLTVTKSQQACAPALPGASSGLVQIDYALVNQRAARSSAVLRSTIPAFSSVSRDAVNPSRASSAARLAFGDDNLGDMTRPAGLAGTCSRSGGRRWHALGRLAPSCAAALRCTAQQHCRDCGEGRGRGCDQNDLPAGHAADDHGVDHDRSGVASAAWFRRRQGGERGGRGCGGHQDGASVVTTAAKRVMRPGVMDAVPWDSRCSSGPIMQSYSPAASGVLDTPIGSNSMSR